MCNCNVIQDTKHKNSELLILLQFNREPQPETTFVIWIEKND